MDSRADLQSTPWRLGRRVETSLAMGQAPTSELDWFVELVESDDVLVGGAVLDSPPNS